MIAKQIQFKTNNISKNINNFINENMKQSKQTGKNYKGDIERFLNYLGKDINSVETLDFENVSYDTIINYSNQFYGKLKNSTINRYVSSVISLLKYLYALGIVENDYRFLSLIKRLPDDSESISYMEVEVAKEFIQEAKKEKHKSNEKQALIYLAIETGLRQAELLSIQWGHFEKTKNGYLLETVGKKNKRRTDLIDIEIFNKMVDLLKPKNFDRKEKLFSLSATNVTYMMKRISKSLGYEDKNYTFHSLRKTAITHVYETTGDITAAQKKGNHSSPTITQRYLADRNLTANGVFSLEKQNKDLYKEVEYDIIVSAIEQLGLSHQYAINEKIKEIIGDE